MKALVTIILFLLFAVTSVKIGKGDATIGAPIKVCITQNAANPLKPYSLNQEAVIPLNKDRAPADMEVADGCNLAHRVSASAERFFRFSSIETFQFIKTLLRKMAVRMANLASCHARVYDTSPSLSWDSACEHYIFGMRRILI